MPDTFPLFLKEGWPDQFLIMIQILIPAGVVDCYVVTYTVLSSEFSCIKFFDLRCSITQPQQKWTCS